MRGVATRKAGKSPRSCISVVIISWVLIVAWLIFLWYCWKSGLLHSSKIAYVDKFINKTEHVIFDRVNKLKHIPTIIDTSSSHLDASIVVPKLYDVHVVFSTDCSGFQDWQTLVVFHSATVVGQLGPITRIASGCDSQKQAVLTALYKKLYPNYHVHFTPDFKHDKKSNKKYDFYNKPYGMEHWLENAMPPIQENVVIALIDPDFVFLRPLTTKIAGESNLIITSVNAAKESFEKIIRGKPVAQQYGLGAPWANDHHVHFNRTKICGAHSPCLEPDQSFAARHYSVGPPYMVEKSDMLRLTKAWTSFVPVVYEGYPHLLAEMYAYSMGAAHERLPHLQVDHYMVSNTDAGGEGWQWVDLLEDVCAPPQNGIYFPGKPLPTFAHHCQFYRAGEMGFQKRRIPHNIFSCESPLLLEPPVDLGFVDYKVNDAKVDGLGSPTFPHPS